MNHHHPERKPMGEKPARPPYEEGKSEDPLSLEDGDDGNAGEDRASPDHGRPSVRPISREAAEKGIPPDPDPDDPVSR